MHRIIELNNQDAPTTAAYVPTEYAERLIEMAGGSRDEQERGSRWVFADGSWYWHREEALLVALGMIADRSES